jgi:hypothetical protein
LPLPSTAREFVEKHFADDFLSRRYVNSQMGAWADVYVVYCTSLPRGILGHRPEVCYPATGWIQDGTEESYVASASGRRIPCLVHRFHMTGSEYRERVVLSFYVVNGRITTREKDFSGIWDRRPNIAGDPARYVAQVQISSVLEDSVRSSAKDLADLILDFLPDDEGQVIAPTSSGALEQADLAQ